jgi:hypothetical protein
LQGVGRVERTDRADQLFHIHVSPPDGLPGDVAV